MPPQIDKPGLRIRRGYLHDDEPEFYEEENKNIKRYKSVDDLSEFEVAIDGIVYDISAFHHPGGEIIKMFGGNDVSNVYKFNHLYHSPRSLDKLKKVGILLNYNEA